MSLKAGKPVYVEKACYCKFCIGGKNDGNGKNSMMAT